MERLGLNPNVHGPCPLSNSHASPFPTQVPSGKCRSVEAGRHLAARPKGCGTRALLVCIVLRLPSEAFITILYKRGPPTDAMFAVGRAVQQPLTSCERQRERSEEDLDQDARTKTFSSSVPNAETVRRPSRRRRTLGRFHPLTSPPGVPLRKGQETAKAIPAKGPPNTSPGGISPSTNTTCSTRNPQVDSWYLARGQEDTGVTTAFHCSRQQPPSHRRQT